MTGLQKNTDLLSSSAVLDHTTPIEYIMWTRREHVWHAPSGEEILVPTDIKEIYIGIPENRISLTIVKCICANGTVLHPVCIIPGKHKMASWFHEKMTGHEMIAVLILDISTKQY